MILSFNRSTNDLCVSKTISILQSPGHSSMPVLSTVTNEPERPANCGRCVYCLDKACFGGPGKKRSVVQ